MTTATRMRRRPSVAFAVALTLIFAAFLGRGQAKVFGRCELAQQLRTRYGFALEEVANWVCIAEHSSGLNSAAYASGLAGGSHGLFQISDVYWCSPPGKGFACNVPCDHLRDDNLSDDMACVRIIYAEHQRISGNGYTAWNAYEQYCRSGAQSYIAGCFPNERSSQRRTHQQQQPQASNALAVYNNFIKDYTPKKQGKIYNQCELAQELYFKHKLPMEQIATWVCIAQHESRFDTSAVGRLNADGSADHGLFQISDLYWCSHDRFSGGKACGLSCGKLLDQDITDDVRCIRRIHDEHTRLSGDGFTAWTVYDPHCRHRQYEHVSHCFNQQTQLPKSYAVAHTQSHLHTQAHTTPAQSHHQHRQYQSNPFLKHAQAKPHYTSTYHSSAPAPAPAPATSTHNHVPYKPHKGKVYKRCELAQELYFKHKFPMQDIATWVCIAEHESNFDTSAVGRLNGDGSADHGLFQVSDLYWCTHDDAFGGKGCGLPCHKLLDSDLTDDIKCIRTIHDEHTRISGDGFTAWTVYNRDCHGRPYDISACFDGKIQHTVTGITTSSISEGSDSVSETSGSSRGKIYQECELARELLLQHKLPVDQIATWVCIAQHESSYNTAAVGRLNVDGSADHGLFQISDLYWCSQDHLGGKACDMPCHKLLDSDISDDVQCIKTIHAEHTRLSGDGFTAWTVYNPHCRNRKWEQISKCFDDGSFNATKFAATIKPPSTNQQHQAIGKGKVYKKCELARELYFKHKMPMEQVPTWVCIAQHESNYDTSAVGRLNADGSADHGLFQISDLYWCSHDSSGGKACNIPCHKLLDNDITDDVHCIRTIYDEHTRISGDGFTAWTVYKPHCQLQKMDSVAKCFEGKKTEHEKPKWEGTTVVATTTTTQSPHKKRKLYKRCELAQELYFKHKMPMWQVPTWVCIAQHESGFDTSAVGRLNADGSADHGLFQISDLYWCSHDSHGGKACNIPCDKLLDSDITDDVHCIKIIYDEHTRISGDGFTAWTVYNRNCRDQQLEKVGSCFESDLLKKAEQERPKTIKPVHKHVASPSSGTGINYNRIADYDIKALKPKLPLNHPFIGNPFLNKFNATTKIQTTVSSVLTTKSPRVVIHQPQIANQQSNIAQHPNYIANPFLQKFIKKGEKHDKKQAATVLVAGGFFLNPLLSGTNANKFITQEKETAQAFATITEAQKSDYSANPFLSKLMKQQPNVAHTHISEAQRITSLSSPTQVSATHSYATNPFLAKFKESNKGASQQKVSTTPAFQQTDYASNIFSEKFRDTNTKTSEAFLNVAPALAKFPTTSTERPFQHNPFLINLLPAPTKPTPKPTQSPPKSTASMQAPKPNNYLNSDSFRHSTMNTTPTPKTATATTIFNTNNNNINIPTNNFSQTPIKKTNQYISTTKLLSTTTERYSNTTTNRPYILATPINTKSSTTRMPITTKTSSETTASTTRRPMNTLKSTTTTRKPTTKTKMTSTSTTRSKNVFSTTTRRSATQTYKQLATQRPKVTVTSTETKSITPRVNLSSTTKTTIKTTTKKPNPDHRWSYNWADYLFTTRKTTPKVTTPLITNPSTTFPGTNNKKFAVSSTIYNVTSLTTTTTKSLYHFSESTKMHNATSKSRLTTGRLTTPFSYTTTSRPKTTSTKNMSTSIFSTSKITNEKTRTIRPTITSSTTKITMLRTPKTTIRSAATSKSTTASKFTTTRRPITTTSPAVTSKSTTANKYITTSRPNTARTSKPITVASPAVTRKPTEASKYIVTSRPTTARTSKPITAANLAVTSKYTTTSKYITTSRSTTDRTSKPITAASPVVTIRSTEASRYTTTRRPIAKTRSAVTSKSTTASRYTTTSRPIATITSKPITIASLAVTYRSNTKSRTTTSRPTTPTKTSRLITTTKATSTDTANRYTTTSRPKLTSIPTVSFNSKTTTLNQTSTTSNTHRTTTTSKLISTSKQRVSSAYSTNDSITASEYAEKYRKDPFSHPFFAKYNKQFELLFGPRKNTTLSSKIRSP